MKRGIKEPKITITIRMLERILIWANHCSECKDFKYNFCDSKTALLIFKKRKQLGQDYYKRQKIKKILNKVIIKTYENELKSN